jgi:hypothetical protein
MILSVAERPEKLIFLSIQILPRNISGKQIGCEISPFPLLTKHKKCLRVSTTLNEMELSQFNYASIG